MDERSPTSTLPEQPGIGARRVGYTVTTVALTLLMGAAVLDVVAPVNVFGVDSDVVRTSSGGIELAVTYGEVSRPALATPFDIRIEQAGGFDGPVRVAVDQEYLRMWDENGLVPAPAAEMVVGDSVVWEFDPPSGDTLLISYDARIEPAAQQGRSGSVAVLDSDDAVLVEVEFTTRVWP